MHRAAEARRAMRADGSPDAHRSRAREPDRRSEETPEPWARRYLLVRSLLEQAFGEHDLNDGRHRLDPRPVALQLASERDPADRLPAGLNDTLQPGAVCLHATYRRSRRRRDRPRSPPAAHRALRRPCRPPSRARRRSASAVPWHEPPRRSSVSSHELTLVRSIGGLSSSSSASSGTVGCRWPEATLIVEWMIGSPNVLAILTVDTTSSSSSSGSIDRTAANCDGW